MDVLPEGYPLVLHGASTVIPEFVEKCNKYGADIPGAQGVPEDLLRKAASMGVAKINVDTDLRLAMTAAIREEFSTKPSEFDPRGYLSKGRDAIREMVKHKIKDVLGCDNEA